MWRMLGLTGLYDNPFRPGDPQGTTEFNCGRQNIGQVLNGEIHLICPEQYPVMVKEYQEWQKKQPQ